MSETGVPATPGVDGETWVKSPNVFPGYPDNPIATADCMTQEGYFKTGNIGHLDAEGNLWIYRPIERTHQVQRFSSPPC